ncbi:MAG: gamma-glutamylcyclotransferase [Oscillospiraceae bacterium]|nr:gamma-glutamylcyclotransferase [Oscillospiraceae bacterium]
MRKPTAPKKMFVYGTLMRGFYNYDKALVGQEKSMVPARTRGRVWHMVDRGYPAIKEGEGWVYGELVELKDFAAVIDQMDDIEGYHGPDDPRNEYARILLPVENLETGKMEEAYVYYYVPDDLGSSENPVVELTHGSWRTYMEEKK